METKRDYEIEMDLDTLLTSLRKNSSVEDYFYIQDLKQRKLFINGEIADTTVDDVVRNIMQFNRDDCGKAYEDRKPILLYINSVGGSVDAGFQLIDVIRSSKTPVYTINTGYQYSMGFLIGLAGHKRFATRNAKYLMHDGSNCIYNSGAKARDQMEFQNRMEERIKEYVISLSHLTSEEYDDKFRVEWYMFAADAKEKGFVDMIVGEDCDIDMIV